MLRAFVTLIVTGGCIVAVLGASQMQQQHTLKNIYLHVRNEEQYQFLDKKAFMDDVIRKRDIAEHTTKIKELDIQGIEQSAYKNPWVANTEVYVDNRNDMHIYVTQRVPVARVFFENGQSCYLDTSLHMLPLSDLFSYYTTVVTNVPWYNNDSLNQVLRGQIVSLVRYVDRHPFWRAQIEQIAVTPDRKFELYPLLGTHKIIFGDTTNMNSKFDNLLAFYKSILNRIGWDKYQIVDLRFKHQVVASPSLPWKMPPKNAMSNMDWLKSIMDTEPKTDTMLIKEAVAKTAVKIDAKTDPKVPVPPKDMKREVKTTTPIIKKETKNISDKPAAKKPAASEKKQERTPKYIYQKKTNQ